jgi:hypothetical protein
MMGTTTYCSTNKIPHKMMMIFCSMLRVCFHVNEFPLEKYLTLYQVGKSPRYKSTLISIKIP